MITKGCVRLDKRTKHLIPRLKPGDIAVICHRDLDEVAARALVAAGVRAVLNCAPSISGRYPNHGPQLIVNHGVHLVDQLPPSLMTELQSGKLVTIRGNRVMVDGETLACGRVLDQVTAAQLQKQAEQQLPQETAAFLDNTMNHARDELEDVFAPLELPDLAIDLDDRPVLVVVRGSGYQEDLAQLTGFIDRRKPVLIGVDGGADALLEQGYRPDIVIGDMDSVSDEALREARQRIVHAYVGSGEAPGRRRLEQLRLPYTVFAAPGISEDAALLLAHDYGANPVVLVGSHRDLVDFLDKGRDGMASTLLTRLRVGPQLVDLKGIARLRTSHPKGPGSRLSPPLVKLCAAALAPVAVLASLSPIVQSAIQIAWFNVRWTLGW